MKLVLCLLVVALAQAMRARLDVLNEFGWFSAKKPTPMPRSRSKSLPGQSSAVLKIFNDKTMNPMTKQKLDLIVHAALLSNAVYTPEDMPADANYYGTSLDAMATQVKDDYCFVAFRGTVGDSVGDWATNMKVRNHELRGCYVHLGFYQAFSGTSENGELFVNSIKSFISRQCSGKQLILTGHSQGGGAAGVGAVVLSQYKPLSILFGDPPFLGSKQKGRCSHLNAGHIWRITNTVNSGSGILYDPVANGDDDKFFGAFNKIPFINIDLMGSYVGETILLPPGSVEGTIEPSQLSLVYYKHNFPAPGLSHLDAPPTVSTHSITNYYKKVTQLAAELGNGKVIATNGFIKGTMCSFDSECRSKKCQNDYCA